MWPKTAWPASPIGGGWSARRSNPFPSGDEPRSTWPSNCGVHPTAAPDRAGSTKTKRSGGARACRPTGIPAPLLRV
jgi:hypothetical protein